MSALGELHHCIIPVNEPIRISNLKKANTLLKDEIELLKVINTSIEAENISLLEAIEALKEDNSVLAHINRILVEELDHLRVACGDKELADTKEKLLQEQKRNEELEVRLKKDSTTSSKPPSTDLGKSKRPIKKKKSGQKTGG